MSALEKQSDFISNDTEPAGQAGIFLPEASARLISTGRQRVFDEEGRLVNGAIQNIQKRVYTLGKQGVGEIVQVYSGYVPAKEEVAVKDNKGKPTGETMMVDVQRPGPNGVDCTIYIRVPIK